MTGRRAVPWRPISGIIGLTMFRGLALRLVLISVGISLPTRTG